MLSNPPLVRPKVLYIIGWGRSGTTLMDNVLGSHEGVFTAGEVTRLWELALAGGQRCGCGAPVVDCAFWSRVFSRAFNGHPDPSPVIAMQKKQLSVLRTPGLIAAARSGRPGSAAKHYADLLSRLYQAIAAETGARVIVDASKRPSDAVITGMASGVDPYLLQMVRDPRACAFSWQRTVRDPSSLGPTHMHRHGRLMNAGHWVSWNLLAEQVAKTFPENRLLRVRYEDFMSEPRSTVQSVFDFLGHPTSTSPFSAERVLSLEPNHTLAGNPGRFRTGQVSVRLDDEWRTGQGRLDRLTTTALSLPWLKRYGYSAAVTPGIGGHGLR